MPVKKGKYVFFALLNLFVPMFLIMGPIEYIVFCASYLQMSKLPVEFQYALDVIIVLGGFPGLLWIIIAFDGVPAFLGLPKHPIISFNGKSYRVVKTEAGVVVQEAASAGGAFLAMLAIRIFGNMFIITFTFIRNFFVFIASLFTEKGHERIVDSGIYFRDAMNNHPHMTRFAGLGCILSIAALVMLIIAFNWAA